MKQIMLLLSLRVTLAFFSAAVTTPAAPGTGVRVSEVAVKGIAATAEDARGKGDPDGSPTGTVADVAVADAKKGLTIGDIANQVGQNKIAINFVWTLITGFLVMF